VKRARILLALWLGACAAPGAELRLHFTALQKHLAEQVFTQEGRKYVRGSPGARCDHAFLENPALAGVNGELVIRARFSGRTALNIFGQCVGIGDAFDLAITAAPYVSEGRLGFRNVRVQPAKTGFYARRVSASLQQSLERELRFDLNAEAKRLLDKPKSASGYGQELSAFQVREVRVSADALILTLDFTLAVR
jgi:hypothetical protein